MKGILLLFVVGFIGTGLANSDSEFDLPTYEANDSIELTGLCFVEGDPCVNGTTCKMFVYYPNFTVMINNGTMSYINNGMFNYTMPENLTDVLGVYPAYMRCNTTDITLEPDSADASFRVVEKLLYKGGGIMAWESAIPFGLFAVAGIFMYIAVNLMRRREALQAMFWLMSLFVIYAGIDVLGKIAVANKQFGIQSILGGINFGVFVIIFLVIAYLLISFLYTQMQKMGKIK